MNPIDRTCPGCGHEKLLSAESAKEVFRIRDWGGDTELLDDADTVCSWCKVVKINGEWTRMQTIASRANELSQASSTKSRTDYRKSLTAGEKRI